MNKIVSKRLTAYLLDIFLIYLLISLIVSIKFINPYYDKFETFYEEYTNIVEQYSKKEITLEEMNELTKDSLYKISKYSISTNIVSVLVIIGYFGLFQKYNNGQTLGKKVTKIKVVDKNEQNPKLGYYLIRLLFIYYIFIGSIIPFIINSILLCLLNTNIYILLSSIITYIFLGIGIIDLVMICIRKDKCGIHELISKTKVVNE